MAQGRRVALVTGGARGIGAAIAEALASDGRAVALADLRLDQAESVAAQIRTAGGQALAVDMDVTDSKAVLGAVERVRSKLGAIEILVNNAGWDELHRFVDTDEAFWDTIIDINFKGGLRLTHAVAPAMAERGWGRIVSVSSDAARVGSSMEAVYSGAKGAIISFTKTLARELARSGVTANVICPGPTETPLLDELVASQADATRVIGAMTQGVPMKRLGRASEVAAAVAFLASEDAGYITGQTLSVSGGLTMA